MKPLATALTTVALCAASSLSAGDGGIRFHDIVPDPGSGIVFEHTEPPRNAILDELKQNPFRVPDDLARVPHKPHGAPGVAILDFDRDGDLDIYVTNSQGSNNSLFSNQLSEIGVFTFLDVAEAAGVGAADHDSTGVCFGDIDNDGDHDLMVLGAIMPNRLYENQGDGTFLDITATAGVGGGDLSTSSCAMGDVDNDGLLDIAVANTHTDWNDLLGIVVPFTFAEHNQLFRNTGGNVFEDVSATSGVEVLTGAPPVPPGAAALTWAVALVDYDLDGDVDFFTFDDQGNAPDPVLFGEDGMSYGAIHLFENDGTGQLDDRNVEAGIAVTGNWMGVSFADFNCDGHLDFFGTNAGDYNAGDGPSPFPLGNRASKWYLGDGAGGFTDPGVGDDLVGTVFGWGTSAVDYDNDGDTDIVYHGAIDVGFIVDASNPGVVLRNEGCGRFVWDQEALAEGADHTRRVGQGLAAGDLNGDGFVDIVTVSNSDLGPEIPLVPRANGFIGSPFDQTAFFAPLFAPPDPVNDPTLLVWTGLEGGNGSLAVEMSSADNGNGWAEVSVAGTIEQTSEGRVNRDGIGAVVSFTTGGETQMRPVTGGSSFASQDSLALIFGMGEEALGTVEVLWPGGVRNRLYRVRTGSRTLFPEIPCSFEDVEIGFRAYRTCVRTALDELEAEGVLNGRQKSRFFASAIRAFLESL